MRKYLADPEALLAVWKQDCRPARPYVARVDEHPEFVLDGSALENAVDAFERNGAIVARQALNLDGIRAVRTWVDAWDVAMHARLEAGDSDVEIEYWTTGGGNLQHACVLKGVGFGAPLVSLLVASPLWPLLEKLIGSTDLVIPLHYIRLRRVLDHPSRLTDAPPGPFDGIIGNTLHQDAAAVHPKLPVSIWIPLQDLALGAASSVGFALGPFRHTFETPIRAHDLGDDLREFWRPAFQLGDVAVFSRYTPHSTTLYGTNAVRYSMELRLCSLDEAPPGIPEQVQVRRNGSSFSFKILTTAGMPFATTLNLLLQQGAQVLPPPEAVPA